MSSNADDVLGDVVRNLMLVPVKHHGLLRDLLPGFSDDDWVENLKKLISGENPWPCQCNMAPRLWEPVDDTSIRVHRNGYFEKPFRGVTTLQISRGDTSDFWMVKRKGNFLFIDGRKIVLHSKTWKTGISIDDVMSLCRDMSTAHPAVLVSLVENPRLIPEAWKGLNVFFFACRYCTGGSKFFLCMSYQHDDVWSLNHRFIEHSWTATDSAAILED